MRRLGCGSRAVTASGLLACSWCGAVGGFCPARRTNSIFGNSGTGCRLVMGAMSTTAHQRGLYRRRIPEAAADETRLTALVVVRRAMERTRRAALAGHGQRQQARAVPIHYEMPVASRASEIRHPVSGAERVGADDDCRTRHRRAITPNAC